MKKQLNTLNFMRVLALIGVLGYHLLPEVMIGGYIGVILFFQLSGFLLAYKSSDINGIKDAIIFYKHKSKRIYGPLTVMILSTLGIFSLMNINGLPVSIHELLSIFGGYNNQWQISQDLSYFARALNQSPYTHLWFIAIEIQFYLLWPFIIIMYKKIKEIIGGGAVLIMYLFAVASIMPMVLLTVNANDISNVYYGSLTRIGALIWGVLAGILYQDIVVQKKWKHIILRLIAYISIAGIVAIYFSLDSLVVDTYTFAIPVITILTGIFLWMITTLKSGFILGNTDKKFNKFLATINTKISAISYDIYLWMFPVIYISNKIGMQTNGYTLCIQVIAMAVCATLSYIAVNTMNKISFNKLKDLSFGKISFKTVISSFITILMLILMLMGINFSTQLPMLTDNSELDELLAGMVTLENEIELQHMELDTSVMKLPNDIIIFEFYSSVQDKIAENAKLKDEYFVEKARLEAEAKAKAEAEAKAKAEAEAKAKAEAEAKAKAASNTNNTNNNSSSGSTTVSAGNGIGVTSSRGVYFYGDSVMLGAAPSLKSTFTSCSVSAVVSRRASTTAKSASSIFGSTSYGTVVIALGTNGGVSESDATKMVESMPDSKRIYFVTVKGVSSASSTNKNLRAVASKYSNVSIIDWNSYASGSTDWVYSDGYHLRPAGQRAYAQLMYNSLG